MHLKLNLKKKGLLKKRIDPPLKQGPHHVIIDPKIDKKSIDHS